MSQHEIAGGVCLLSCFFASPTFLAAFVRSSCWIYSLRGGKGVSMKNPSHQVKRDETVPIISNSKHACLRHDVPQVCPIKPIREL